jgi:hypothetical protein
VQALLKTAIENRKTHLRRKERKKGDMIFPTNPLCQTTADVPFALPGERTMPSTRPASANGQLPWNRRRIEVAIMNGTNDSDTELGGNRSRLGDGHSESDEVHDSDEHVGNPKISRAVPKKGKGFNHSYFLFTLGFRLANHVGTKRAGQSRADLTRRRTRVNHQVKGKLLNDQSTQDLHNETSI